MFSLPFCWSIAIYVLLVIVFGITEFSLGIPGKSFSSNETCVNVSREIICYFKGSEELMAWNRARQLCSSLSSTLPVIRNRNEQNALAGYLESLEGNTAAWTAGIKVENRRWAWIKGGQREKFDEAEPKDEIRYTNWDKNRYARNGTCISISTSDGKWKALGCNETLAAVCQKGQGLTTALTTVENIQTRLESSTFVLKENTGTTQESRGSTRHSSAVFVESITHGSQDSTLQSLSFLALVAGIVIIICLIIFALWTKNRSVIEMCDFNFNNRSPRSNREELHSRATNAYTNTTVNEYESVIPAIVPVERSNDTRDDYEEISSLTLNQSGDGATEQQPGVDDASLACRKEPVNLEPEKKHDHTHASSKIGPLGDTYAIPVARGLGDNSPGGYTSHPIKVTAQGDVYALPTKRSKSSTSNRPGEVLYVNLPTEMLGKEQTPTAHVQTNASSNATSSCERAENGRYEDLETTRRLAKPDGIYTKLKLQPLYEEVCQLGNR